MGINFTEQYDRISVLTPKHTDHWLYAAVRSIRLREETDVLQQAAKIALVHEELSKRTPQRIAQMFPPDRQFNGLKWREKDGISSLQALARYEPDKPIGRHLDTFLDEWMCQTLFVWRCAWRQLTAYGKRPIRRRAKAALRAYGDTKSVFWPAKLCEAFGVEEAAIQVINLLERNEPEAFYRGTFVLPRCEFYMPDSDFGRLKDILIRFIGEDDYDKAKRHIALSAEVSEVKGNQAFFACALDRRVVRALKRHWTQSKAEADQDMLRELNETWRRFSLFNRLRQWVWQTARQARQHVLFLLMAVHLKMREA